MTTEKGIEMKYFFINSRQISLTVYLTDYVILNDKSRRRIVRIADSANH